MTILSVVALAIFFAIQLSQAIRQEKYTINNTSYVRDLYRDQTTYDFTLADFDFAFQLSYEGTDPLILQENLQSYFSLQLFEFESHLKTNYSEGEYPQESSINVIPLGRCLQSRFAGISDDDNSKWWCAQVDTFKLRGGIAGSLSRFMHARLVYCDQTFLSMNFPGQTCKTKEQADAIAPYTTFLFAQLEQYFESAGFDTPIKYFLKANYFSIGTDIKYMFCKVGKQRAILKDSWVHSSYNERNLTYTTFNIEFIDTRRRFEDSLFKMYIYLDEKESTTTRTVFNLIDALSTTGGFSSIITLFFAFTTKRIQQKLYFLSMMKKLYLCLNRQSSPPPQQNFDNPNNFPPSEPLTLSKRFQQLPQNQEQFADIDSRSNNQDLQKGPQNQKNFKDSRRFYDIGGIDQRNRNDSDIDLPNSSRPLKEQKYLVLDNSLQQDPILNKVMMRLSQTKELEFSFQQYILDKIIRACCPCKRRKLTLQEIILKEGVLHLQKELDIIRFFKKARIAESLGHLSLTKFQRDLIPYLNNNILSIENNDQKLSITTISGNKSLSSQPTLRNQLSLSNKASVFNRSQIISQSEIGKEMRDLYINSQKNQKSKRLLQNLIFEDELKELQEFQNFNQPIDDNISQNLIQAQRATSIKKKKTVIKSDNFQSPTKSYHKSSSKQQSTKIRTNSKSKKKSNSDVNLQESVKDLSKTKKSRIKQHQENE
eukprot:403349634